MELTTYSNEHRAQPGRPVRVLIEDPVVAGAVDLAPPPWVEVVTCAGPRGRQVCPLVAEGDCPARDVDVVVTALGGGWSASVQRAWQDAGVVPVDGCGCEADDPAARLRHHLGAALGTAFADAPGS